jgi:phosphoglycolate phosphatase
MIHKLSHELSIEEEEILDDFRDVYLKHGTVEYPRAVNELTLWDRNKISDKERKRISEIVDKVFSINYRSHLRLFPNVREVLMWTREEGIPVIGLSDALERWVCYRLRILGIEKYFAGLYTWQHDQWFDDRHPHHSSIKTRVQLNSNELKPNLEVVNRVLADFSLNRETTFMVGDSLSKDIAVAQTAGVNDVWARYGTRPHELNLNTLRRITPWSESEKAKEKNAKLHIVPTFIIDDFHELIGLIGTRRPKLFD